jgi:hypothetical protein
MRAEEVVKAKEWKERKERKKPKSGVTVEKLGRRKMTWCVPCNP